jgi:hypothetical protein
MVELKIKKKIKYNSESGEDFEDFQGLKKDLCDVSPLVY